MLYISDLQNITTLNVQCQNLALSVRSKGMQEIERMSGKGWKLQEERSYNGMDTEFLVFWQCQDP